MTNKYKNIFSERSFFEGTKINLRKFRVEDVENVLMFGSDEKALKYLIWEGVHSFGEAMEAINGFYAEAGVFAIVLKDSDKAIGAIDIRPDWVNEKASFGYVTGSEHWNNGYVSEALAILIKFCFDELNFHRVEAVHFAGNEASGRVMEKCGMVQEGISLQSSKVKGVFVDEIHYGLLAENAIT
ncbi:GNAT family N-acetyltransferase [Tyzzerella sp. OttesenSCG-928-J15]|nr:GNAT family N-acetyltransferase [Tyzzerella sp. OttesenSCG-928-J15]